MSNQTTEVASLDRRSFLGKAAALGVGAAATMALAGCASNADAAGASAKPAASNDDAATTAAASANAGETEKTLADLQEQVDWQNSMITIRNQIAQYCLSMDLCDPDLGYATTWDDAPFYYANGDYCYFEGTGREFVDYSMDLHMSTFLDTTHDLTVSWIQVKGDKAVSESRGLIYIQWPAGETPTGRTTEAPYTAHHQNRYIDYWERRDGEWRVAQRYCLGDTSLYLTENGVDSVSYDSPRGDNRTEDKLYELLKKLD